MQSALDRLEAEEENNVDLWEVLLVVMLQAPPFLMTKVAAHLSLGDATSSQEAGQFRAWDLFSLTTWTMARGWVLVPIRLYSSPRRNPFLVSFGLATVQLFVTESQRHCAVHRSGVLRQVLHGFVLDAGSDLPIRLVLILGFRLGRWPE